MALLASSTGYWVHARLVLLIVILIVIAIVRIVSGPSRTSPNGGHEHDYDHEDGAAPSSVF